MRSRPLLIVTLSMLLGGALFSIAMSDDSVYDLAGKKTKLKGKATKMSKDAVTMTDAAGDKEVKVTEISRIKFDNEPSDLDRARTNYGNGNFQQALDTLNQIAAPQSDESEFVRPDIEYYLAMATLKVALQKGDDKKPAEELLLAFAKKHSSNYHFYAVAEALGDLAVSENKFDDALKYYKALSSSSYPELKMRAQVAEGRVLVSQEKFSEAAAKFAEVLGSGTNTAEAQEQKNIATVANAICTAANGDVAGAVTTLQDVINKNDDIKNPKLFAKAYNALGNCYLRSGAKKEAMLAFLQTHTLFFVDPDAHAEALYRLVVIYDELKMTDRANDLRASLQERYRGSPWTARIR
jgi:tetratricopeptide (TPR) repeat protein